MHVQPGDMCAHGERGTDRQTNYNSYTALAYAVSSNPMRAGNSSKRKKRKNTLHTHSAVAYFFEHKIQIREHKWVCGRALGMAKGGGGEPRIIARQTRSRVHARNTRSAHASTSSCAIDAQLKHPQNVGVVRRCRCTGPGRGEVWGVSATR